MNNEGVLKEKSKAFGIRVTKLVRYFVKQTPVAEHPVFTQLIKAGTSVGANVCESEFAESRNDFVHKLKIALKEASEAEYWIDIIFGAEYLKKEQYESIIADCKELIKLLIASINTINNNNKGLQ